MKLIQETNIIFLIIVCPKTRFGIRRKICAYLPGFRTRNNYRQIYQPIFGQKTTVKYSYYVRKEILFTQNSPRCPGFDKNGLLYGAMDFVAYYLPFAKNPYGQDRFFRKLFNGEKMEEYEKISSPSIKHRGLWSWGHVIYDYRKYIENMAKLKMNTLIIWNDFVPVNVSDVINAAHEYGIKIYLGFSWGWNEARPVNEFKNGTMSLSDELLESFKENIVKTYYSDYADLELDGIYFQSFTETNNCELSGEVIAERVVKLMHNANSNTTVTALVEDGMFESEIRFPVALYGEMMWDCNKDLNCLMTEVAMRTDVEM